MEAECSLPETPDFVASTLDELYAPVRDELDEVELRFRNELRSRFDQINSLTERVAGYGGKRLRPALLLLTAKACGRIVDAHLTLAAVVEMVHVATLVHDDVLDDAEFRRSEVTVNQEFGNVMAVLLGDYLISHAFHLCSSLDSALACRLIGASTNTVCEGELRQTLNRGNMDLNEADYLDIIRSKTAALTETCCHLGAHFAGADTPMIEALRRFGRDAGTAFQIVDDVLDLTGDAAQMGKPSGSDWGHANATLPTIHCLSSIDRNERQSWVAQLRNGRADLNGSWKQRAARTGSIDYAILRARSFVDSAIDALTRLPPSSSRRSLERLTGFILRRSR